MQKRSYRHLLSVVGILISAAAQAHEFRLESPKVGNVSMLGIAIGVDSLGNRMFCYQDDQAGDLRVAIEEAAGWQVTIVDAGGAGRGRERRTGEHCRLQFDRLDQPHVVYFQTAQDLLRHAWLDGAQWRVETIDPDVRSGFQAENRPSLAIAPDGNIGVAYYAARERDLRLATQRGQGWVIETVQSQGLVGGYPSLAFTSQSQAALTYQRNENGRDSALEFVQQVDQRWQPADVLATGRNAGMFSAVQFDAQDRPHVAYRAETAERASVLRYTNRNHGVWRAAEDLDAYSMQDSGGEVQMVVGPNDDLHLVYRYDMRSALFPPVNYLRLISLHFMNATGAIGSQQTSRVTFSAAPTRSYLGLSLAINDQYELSLAFAEGIERRYETRIVRLMQWSPTIMVQSPEEITVVRDGRYAVRWLDFDPDSQAQIRFAVLDANWHRTDLRGTVAEAGRGEHALDLSGLADGEYRVLAEISDDDFALPQGSLSPASLRIETPRPAPAPVAPQPAPAPADQPVAPAPANQPAAAPPQDEASAGSHIGDRSSENQSGDATAIDGQATEPASEPSALPGLPGGAAHSLTLGGCSLILP